jgi:hypothetical protein
MRMILLSAVFALGVGFAATTGASAAPIGGTVIDGAATANSLLEEAQYRRYRRHYCRTVRVCRMGPYGRRCTLRRVCR